MPTDYSCWPYVQHTEPETPVETPKRLVWLTDGDVCYSSEVEVALLQDDGTVIRDGRRMRWKPWKP